MRRTDPILKAFLSQYPTDLTQFLPEKEKTSLEKLGPIAFKEEEGSLLDKVHWSWFLPTLKTYSESEQKLFLASVNPYAAKNLAKALILSPSLPELTEISRSYFRKLLTDSLVGPHNLLLPTAFLPPSPLNRLLELNKRELIRLIDFLSLHDLAAELRQIVETKILKKIYSFLSGEEKNFLKKISTQKEPFILARLGLEKWDGSEEPFRSHLHKRGLARLGAALSGQDPDLIWYLCHKLDIGRGAALHKFCMKEPIHGVTEPILGQVEELL